MKNGLIIGITVIAAVIIAGWLTLRSGRQDLTTNSGATPATGSSTISTEIAPIIELKDYAGNIISTADFAGKPLVLNAWASWCPFCVNELPDLAAVQEEFGDQVVIIAIDRVETKKVAQSYSDDLGLTDKLIFLLDPGDAFYQAIGGFSMPETLFVNADGTINFHKRGPMAKDEIRQRVQALLQ